MGRILTTQTADVPAVTATAWWQLYITYSIIFKTLERALAPTGLTLPQALGLTIIAESPTPVTPSRLTQELTQETQSVTGLIDRMEKQQWVRRARDLTDRRAIRLEVLPDGAAKLNTARPLIDAATDRIFAMLDGRAAEKLTALLERLYAGAGAGSPAGRAVVPGGQE